MQEIKEEKWRGRGGRRLRCPSIHPSIHPSFLPVRVLQRDELEGAKGDVTDRRDGRIVVGGTTIGCRGTTPGRVVIRCRHIQRRLDIGCRGSEEDCHKIPRYSGGVP